MISKKNVKNKTYVDDESFKKILDAFIAGDPLAYNIIGSSFHGYENEHEIFFTEYQMELIIDKFTEYSIENHCNIQDIIDELSYFIVSKSPDKSIEYLTNKFIDSMIIIIDDENLSLPSNNILDFAKNIFMRFRNSGERKYLNTINKRISEIYGHLKSKGLEECINRYIIFNTKVDKKIKGLKDTFRFEYSLENLEFSFPEFFKAYDTDKFKVGDIDANK